MNFCDAGYVPQPKQLQFHVLARKCDAPDGPDEIAFGGARGPGKSHAMLAQMALDDCQRVDGLKCLLLRKVGKAVRESFEDLRMKVLPYIQNDYNKSSGVLTFPNNSRIILGHFHNEADIDNYLGLEYDLIGVEECTTLAHSKYKNIRTCCRTTKTNWRPRTYSNANPGGIGHAWYKAAFISEPGHPRFVPATFRDNAFLNEDYAKVFDGLVDWQLRAWRDGDWDIHAGMYFTNFNHDIHIIPSHDVKAKGYTFYISMDYGFQHPTVALLLANGGMGTYVIDEYAAAKRLTKVHSNALDEMLARWKLTRRDVRAFVIGQDAWQVDKDGTSVADEYVTEGWHPEKASMARITGAQEILRCLGDPTANIAPSLWIFDNCVNVAEQLPQMQHDPRKPEDVLKVDVDYDGTGGDDYYDALRYGLQEISGGPGGVTYGTLSVPR